MKHLEDYWTTDHFWGEYDDIVETFADILVKQYLGDYQGDILYLIESNGVYGFLVVGYGSCSGCDILQACKTLEHVEALRVEILNSVRWFGTLKAAKEYIGNDSQSLKWHYYESGWNEFVEKVKSYE